MLVRTAAVIETTEYTEYTERESVKRIYIAGPMRGVEDFNRAAFTEHAARLRALGWAVENPVEIGGRFGTVEEIASNNALLRRLMAYELVTIRSVDAVFMLSGWEFSEGARRELQEALTAGLPVFLQKITGALPRPEDCSPQAEIWNMEDKTNAVRMEQYAYKGAELAAERAMATARKSAEG